MVEINLVAVVDVVIVTEKGVWHQRSYVCIHLRRGIQINKSLTPSTPIPKERNILT